MFQVTVENPDDAFEVEYLYDLAFAPGREALSSYRLREGVEPVSHLSLVARDEVGSLAGAIRFWPVAIGARRDAALLLGPIAVHPTHQGEGLGGGLIGQSLENARDQGWQRVVLVGDAPYYSRFGFEHRPDIRFSPPTNPARVLSHALIARGFTGVSGLVQSWNPADNLRLEDNGVRSTR